MLIRFSVKGLQFDSICVWANWIRQNLHDGRVSVLLEQQGRTCSGHLSRRERGYYAAFGSLVVWPDQARVKHWQKEVHCLLLIPLGLQRENLRSFKQVPFKKVAYWRTWPQTQVCQGLLSSGELVHIWMPVSRRRPSSFPLRCEKQSNRVA